jgi:GR25 family glycosyltransferase involved in LPS biosynthesis
MVKYNWLYNSFDQIYVITLDKRVEKMRKFFKSINCNPTYFRAISKYEISRDDLLKEHFIADDCVLNMGRICCHRSHCHVLERFLSSDAESAIIFEDDNDSVNAKDAMVVQYVIEYIMSTIPKDWEMVNFSRCWDDCDIAIDINESTVKTFRALCRNCYAVSRVGAEKMLKHTIPMRTNIPGDQSITRIMKIKPFLKAYASKSNLFSQNRTHITSELGNMATVIKDCDTKHKQLKK